MATIEGLEHISKVYNLFKRRHWMKNDDDDVVFESFCSLINTLNTDGINLIYELAENFLWMSGAEYEHNFSNLLDNIKSSYLEPCKEIFIIPVIKPSDRKKIKSSSHCAYLIKNLFGNKRKYQNINITMLSDFEIVAQNQFKTDGSHILLLVDDFVGTADTFERAWSDLTINKTITTENSFLLTLVIQNTGLKVIRENIGLEVLFHTIINRGISDYFDSPLKEEKIQIMIDIEKKIKPGNKYSLGYKKSEALVKMINTPNNTFPVFWKKYKVNETEIIPPFVRNI